MGIFADSAATARSSAISEFSKEPVCGGRVFRDLVSKGRLCRDREIHLSLYQCPLARQLSLDLLLLPEAKESRIR